MSLNPALEDVRFCPRCGQPADVAFPRSIRCESCGYGAFFNPKPVACAIPRTADERIILMRRGFEPSRGLWTMPGGFVDLGESVEEAAIRETKEEVAVDIEITDSWVSTLEVPTGSWSWCTRRGPTARRPGPRRRWKWSLRADHHPMGPLAFWSDGRALRDYLSLAADGAVAGSS